MTENKFFKVFGNKPILAMIHLSGGLPVNRALDEITIFEEEGIDGIIVENYHGNLSDVEKTLKQIQKLGTKLVIGVNILPNEYKDAFRYTSVYGGKFIQIDHVAGKYTRGEIDPVQYPTHKEKNSEIIVLGGIWPKYYMPLEGSNLEYDLKLGMQRAEAIVVTGEGTGKETPLEKIEEFRRTLGNHPLIVGAGLTPENVYEQLSIADGGIVGSSLKHENQTYNAVDRIKVMDFMQAVKEIREH